MTMPTPTVKQQQAIDQWLPELKKAKESVVIWEAAAAAVPSDTDPDNEAAVTVRDWVDQAQLHVTELVQTLRALNYEGEV